MPPRKSDVSKVATGDEATPMKEPTGVNIEDYNLPKSIVTRLAKGVLPPNTQIQGNAMLAMTKSATVFVNYLASAANENAAASNRKTITPQDVLNALDELEFAEFRPRLEAELQQYNEMQAEKRTATKNKQADSKAAAKNTENIEVEGQDREGQPAAKKARIDPDGSLGTERSLLPEGEHMDDDVGEDDGGEDEPEDDDEEADQEEQEEDEDEENEPEEREIVGEDEALDNGEDSD